MKTLRRLSVCGTSVVRTIIGLTRYARMSVEAQIEAAMPQPSHASSIP